MRDSYGSSAIHQAAWNGHLSIVKLLVEAGVDINEQDIFGETPVHMMTDLKSLKVTLLY